MRRRVCLALLVALSGPACAGEKEGPLSAMGKGSDVLATVNGQGITRADVAGRVWERHAMEALNQLVDESLVAQAWKAWQAAAGEQEKAAYKASVEARVQSVKARFPEGAFYTADMRKADITMEDVRREIEDQAAREALVTSAKRLTVTPREARDFFDANRDKLGSPDAVRLRHILVATEPQAKDLLVAIRVGADFIRLAREITLDAPSKEQGGDLGFVSRGMLRTDIEKVVFGLKPGEVSEPVKGPLGYHIFRVEEIRQAKPAAYADTERDIMKTLLAQKVSQAWPGYLKELRSAARIAAAPGVGIVGEPPPAPSPKR